MDPGITYSGYGLVELYGNKLIYVSSGTIGLPKSSMQIPERIEYHFKKLSNIIGKHSPSEMALEKVFYSKNVKMAIELSHIRGALILSGKLSGLAVHEYTPLEIKQASVGYGKATKNQVHDMVKKLLRNPPLKDSHAADALAAAICHSHSSSLSSRIRDLMR